MTAPVPGDAPQEDKPFSLLGYDLFGEPVTPESRGPLAARFGVPPFSVLNAREGEWQERKAAWLGLGIKSELGRGDQLIASGGGNTSKERYSAAAPGGSARPAMDYSKNERGDGAGKPLPKADARTEGSGGPGDLAASMNAREPAATALSQRLAPGGGGAWLGGPKTASSEKFGADGNALGFSAAATIKRHGVGYDGSAVLRGEEAPPEEPSGTSIFDPVLAELCYRWFCPPGGQVVDPFAGGSVRGIVAGLLGFRYHGIDLSAPQLQANATQRDVIAPDKPIVWVLGDSAERMREAPEADMIFSCPPYGDLERYSDDPADLSTMEYRDFLAAFRRIIQLSAARLKPDRMACMVVGDFRDKKTGYYRGFVADTINLFREAGLALYNDAVLVTAVGSLPIRVSGQFDGSRKLGKTHQNVLCFAKGDPRKAFEAGK